MRRFKRILFILIFLMIAAVSVLWVKRPYLFKHYETGEAIDSLHHVKVYYNGSTGNVQGRNLTADGYNLGLRYQCVEFVKRYYYEHYEHKMPNVYGNAVDFFDPGLADETLNHERALMKYTNPSGSKPCEGDLVVYSGGFGHVAIVSEVCNDEVQIIQQNGGIGAPTRVWYNLTVEDGHFKLENERILGWLRIP